MPNTDAEKRQAIQSLLAIYNNSIDLELFMRHQKNPTASTFDAVNTKLSEDIDALIADAISSWRDDAAKVAADMAAVNNNLTSTIADIQKDITNAAHIVKALGYLDDAISAAIKLLPLAAL